MAHQSAGILEAASAQVHAVGRVIANFAWQHMKAASTLRDHVVTIENQILQTPFGAFSEDIRSYGSGCVMSAAASLEALINEFFITPDGPLRAQLPDFDVAFWGRGGIEWKPPLEKYQVALQMLGKARFDEQASPYLEAWALIELRSALVHYKPTWDPDRQRKVDLIEVLQGRYELSPFPDSGADFITMRSMSASCMRWILATSMSFLREFHARAQLDDRKMAGFWRLDA